MSEFNTEIALFKFKSTWKTALACCTGFLLFATSLSVQAEDLLQVYRQALFSDPTFKEAEATWLSTKEKLAIAETGTGVAGSGLFPYVDITGQLNRTHERVAVQNVATSGYYNGNEYLLTVTQPIFNYATWKSISTARYTVKSGTATYLAAAQDLMYRVSDAYFNVLSANDTLQYTLAQKKQFLHQLITAQEKFKVGLIAITGVYDAKASYDSSVAEAISDRNSLLDQIENLHAITGHYYKSLKGLNKAIPLVVPKPANINDWVKISLAQNYTIKADQNTMLADRELIKEAEAGRYPEVTGVAAYGAETTGSVSAATPQIPDIVTTSGYVAVDLDFPVFQGGYVSASSKQAEYNYLASSDALEYEHRDVVNKTRQSYLGVESGISKIQADQQSIDSARNQLEATEAGYTVGTRTMVDVLDSVTSLYQSKETWSTDRYDYVMNLITLKQEAGTLSPDDIKQLNRWLVKNVTFNLAPIKINKKYNTIKLPSVKNAQPKTKQPSLRDSLRQKGATLETPKSTSATTKQTLTEATTSRYYAIQLFADNDGKAAQTFFEAQTVPHHDLQVVTSNYSGKDWHRVLYGHYTTRTAADNALKEIPDSLKQYHPWVVLLLHPYHPTVAKTTKSQAKSATTAAVKKPAVAKKTAVVKKTAVAKKPAAAKKATTTASTKLAAPQSTKQVHASSNVPSLNEPATDQKASRISLPAPGDSSVG